jgi:hypothetical protein
LLFFVLFLSFLHPSSGGEVVRFYSILPSKTVIFGVFKKSYQHSLFCAQSLCPSAFPLFFIRCRQPLSPQSFQRILRGAFGGGFWDFWVVVLGELVGGLRTAVFDDF